MPEDNSLENELRDLIREESNPQEVVFPDVQKVEVTNPAEPEEIDLSKVESALTGILERLSVKGEKIDLSLIESRLNQILQAVDIEVKDKEAIDYSDVLNAIKDAIPVSFDFDEYFERLEEQLDKLDISNEIKEGLKGFHSSGWLPVVQAVNDLETSMTDGSSKCSVAAQDSFSIDAFGRWRVSDPTTIFDSKQLYDDQPLFWDDQETSGSGTGSTHSVNEAATTMSVGASTAGTRVRQTFMRFNYQPGKSQEILCTFGEFDTATGITKKVGYFDEKNGLFAESDEGAVSLVRRSYVTGSAVDTKVAQADWNLDPMDGTGPSGVTLDWTKTQILFIDFEWLGVGRVRMGFVVDGKIYYAHAFNNANNLATVYMSTPNLPIRYEISNDGNGAADDFCHICSSVMSEGGVEKNGILRHYDGPELSLSIAHTKYVLMAGRLKSTHLGLSIDVENISILLPGTNDQGHWALIFGGTPSSALSFADVPNSGVQIADGDGSITLSGGTEIDGGYVSTKQSVTFTIPSAARLGSEIDGTPQVWYLVGEGHTNNTDFSNSVTWRELL